MHSGAARIHFLLPHEPPGGAGSSEGNASVSVLRLVLHTELLVLAKALCARLHRGSKVSRDCVSLKRGHVYVNQRPKGAQQIFCTF